MEQKELKGRIFDIQGMSTHDGPGGRTLIFFKGCPLRCYWCCNPEGLKMEQEVMYRESKCVRCGRCEKGCPKQAISLKNPEEGIWIDREICHTCTTFECMKKCYYEGLKLVSKDYTLDEVFRRLERDSRFWSMDGGVTFGGGECMMQFPFLLELAKGCKLRYMHVAMETSGMAPEEHYMAIIPYVDWFFMDIKHMDTAKHKEATGMGNELILKNIRNVAKHRKLGTKMVVRIPCIIGFNDTEENICATTNFLKEIGVDTVNILPFHRLGASKYKQLHMSYRCEEMKPPKTGDMIRIQKYVESCGITCYNGSNTPF